MTRRRVGVLVAAAVLACFVAFWAPAGGTAPALLGEAEAQAAQKRPNILFIFIDDADASMLRAMDNVNERIKARGATFENATFAMSLCCPNRASMLRGQFPHNTEVFDNRPPNGGYRTFTSKGLDRSTYATTINSSNYDTFYAGKYLNGYNDSQMDRKPPGWDFWYGSEPKGNCFSDNGVRSCPPSYRNTLHDRWLADKAVPWIKAARSRERPFLATLSFFSPHAPSEHPQNYADRYSTAVHRPDSYDEPDVSDKPAWVRSNPPITTREETVITREYRDRLRSADFADDQIGRVLDALRRSGELDNTYVVFWSDNGYHVGEHRLTGKVTPYKEASRFPLFVKGPGIRPGVKEKAMINTVDIRATLEDMAVPRANSPGYEDGRSFLATAKGSVGAWGPYTYAEAPGPTGGGGEPDRNERPPWQAVFTATTAYHFYPNTEEEEFYDLTEDRHQLNGAVEGDEQAAAREHREVLRSFTGCSGQDCRQAGKP